MKANESDEVYEQRVQNLIPVVAPLTAETVARMMIDANDGLARLRSALQTIQETAHDAIRREGVEARGGGDYWQIEADARAALGMPEEER